MLVLHIFVWCHWSGTALSYFYSLYIDLLKLFHINITRCSNYLARLSNLLARFSSQFCSVISNARHIVASCSYCRGYSPRVPRSTATGGCVADSSRVVLLLVLCMTKDGFEFFFWNNVCTNYNNGTTSHGGSTRDNSGTMRQRWR